MSNDDYDSGFIAEALPAFISEANEHIQMLEQLLLQLETNPHDRDLLDALFRSAHTIKGSAGIFGIDPVVAFTHHVETLLEQMRAGKRELTPEISTLLLQCNDQIRVLVGAAAEPQAEDAETLQVREALVQRLRSAYGGDSHPAQPGSSAAATTGALSTAAPAAASDRVWRIAVQVGVDTFRNGMDPLAILNYLRGIGTPVDVECDLSSVTDLDAINP